MVLLSIHKRYLLCSTVVFRLYQRFLHFYTIYGIIFILVFYQILEEKELELPNKFKEKIINRYGKTGKEWLNGLDFIVEKYQSKFGLEKVELIEKLSMNVVFFAKSHQFGEIILKIGAPSQAALHEINIIQQYSPLYTAKCYFFNTDDRVMLLERLFPGQPLNHLPKTEERIKVFCNLANHLLINNYSPETFPSFETLFYKDVTYATQNKSLYVSIMPMITFANQLYQKIQEYHLPKYILHNDLHHKNILQSKDNWKAIDPHGIIGERCLECCQFLRQELTYFNLEPNSIRDFIKLFAQYFQEDEILMLEFLYIYVIRKVIWYIQFKFDSSTISYNIELCKKLLYLLEH